MTISILIGTKPQISPTDTSAGVSLFALTGQPGYGHRQTDFAAPSTDTGVMFDMPVTATDSLI